MKRDVHDMHSWTAHEHGERAKKKRCWLCELAAVVSVNVSVVCVCVCVYVYVYVFVNVFVCVFVYVYVGRSLRV
jgi:hypothetical protein